MIIPGTGKGLFCWICGGGWSRNLLLPLGGAFRPQWKAPLQIVATCRQGKSGNYIRRAVFVGRFRTLSLSR